ncbi:MAG: ribonuclease HI family protein [bacterium]|nr:ribonuclease HI family protein [bacterium]
MSDYIIYTDGASRGNPGKASIGAVVCDGSGNTLKEVSEYLGIATNNVAEYTAIVRALEELKKVVPKEKRSTARVEVRLDSELAERQLKGVYRVKNKALQGLHEKICAMREVDFPHLVFKHVRREYNKDADRLANQALDAI